MHSLIEGTADSRSAVDFHPMNGVAMSGAEIVVQVLADEGCQTVFGYSGGAILPVYDAVFRFNEQRANADGRDSMQLVVPANEQGAGFMASGYARASGKVGVVLVTSGPGATNLVTPIRDAAADSVPLVAICGQVSTRALGSDAFQEAPVTGIMSACAKHVFLVTEVETLEATLRTAFEIARSGRPGPVVVDLPKNVQTAQAEYDGGSTLAIPGFRSRMRMLEQAELNDEDCAAFFDRLSRASRPLIYAGGGVVVGNAADELTEFADTFGVPVTTTLMGIGGYNTRAPLALHMLGMHGTAYANYAVDDCDFLFAVAARFDDRVAGVPEKFAAGAKCIAQIDIDEAEIGKVKRADWHHVGQLKPALKRLLSYGVAHGVSLNCSEWHRHIQLLKEHHALNFKRDGCLIQPQAVIEAISRHAGGTAVVSTGVGQHQMWAAQYFDFSGPRQWLTSGSMGTMGFGLPAAIGAQFARPDALVVDVDGDGSIRMNLGELETVTTYNLPIKVVVLNNRGDGMVRQWQRLFFKGRFSASDKNLHRKDFVRAALADGFQWARRIEHPEDVNPVVSEFLSWQGPAFLEVMIDPDAGVYPMVGPGASYSEMITGDFIRPRLSSRDSDIGSQSWLPTGEHEKGDIAAPTHMF